LDISQSSALTDVAVDAIAAGNPQLQRLNVMLCPEITNASMIELSHHCNDLRSLDISFDTLITEESILAIAANCPNFNELVYGGDADEFSNNFTASIGNSHPAIKIIYWDA
jgi:hypothetical protein